MIGKSVLTPSPEKAITAAPRVRPQVCRGLLHRPGFAWASQGLCPSCAAGCPSHRERSLRSSCVRPAQVQRRGPASDRSCKRSRPGRSSSLREGTMGAVQALDSTGYGARLVPGRRHCRPVVLAAARPRVVVSTPVLLATACRRWRFARLCDAHSGGFNRPTRRPTAARSGHQGRGCLPPRVTENG